MRNPRILNYGVRRILTASLLVCLVAQPCLPAQAPVPKPSIVQAIVRAAGLEARIMWMDATANLDDLDTPAKVADVMEHCRKSNINTVVVDVKPLIGEVLYPSKIAPRLTTYRGKQYDAAFDLMATALEEGHKRGLKVYAAINVFSEGNKLLGHGPAYSKPEWQAICYVADRSIVTPDGAFPVTATDDSPGADGMAVLTQASGATRRVKPGETYAVMSNGIVEAVMSSDSVDEGAVPIPDDGFLLVAQGSASDWMVDRLRPGVTVSWDETDRLVPIVKAPSERVSVFVNPINPEPRDYEISVMKEIAANYAVDGIVFDRMRYSSLSTDFSDLSRQAFENWAGVRIQNWPGDMFGYTTDPSQEAARGPYYRRWLEWRSRNLKAFAREATTAIRTVRPSAKCAAYVGSWYPMYYGVGVNWASDEYNAAYDWMTDKYYETGYAPLMDWLCTGTYYAEAYRATAAKAGKDPYATVENGAAISNTVVNDAAFVYASISIESFTGRPGPMVQAIQAGLQESQGVMLFDLVYILQNNLWGVLEQAFPQPAVAPHDIGELLNRIKDVRALLPPRPVKPTAVGSQNWKLVVPE